MSNPMPGSDEFADLVRKLESVQILADARRQTIQEERQRARPDHRPQPPA